VILVTHDRYFLDQVANQIIAFPEFQQSMRKLESFADLSQWEAWQSQKQEVLKSPGKKETPPEGTRKKRKLSYHETRELFSMEETIQTAESKIAKIEKELVNPEIQSQPQKLTELYQELHEAQQALENLYARWAELEALASQ
jgi:ATP-binding cassette subfamily F protein uup